MGHSNILVSQRYVHPTPEWVEMAFAGLDACDQERTKQRREKTEKESPEKRKTSIRRLDALDSPLQLQKKSVLSPALSISTCLVSCEWDQQGSNL